jgi:two-component system, NtrC family, response regulator AtoC
MSKNDKTTVPEQIAGPIPEDIVFGTSPVMQAIRRKVGKLAQTVVPVLIQGESGTGKEILARYIHVNSPYREGPFIKVSCAAIPNELTESELFGYSKGAFTGANDSKPGRVEMAHLGSLYLDEIAELDPTRQAKLLQVLQDGRFYRIGDQEETRIDTRVICATNRNLEKEIIAGAFRQDLFYRINVFHIFMPPLRQRREDIPAMAQHLVTTCARRFDRPRPSLSGETLRWMQNHDWPGNIRELENWVVRYVLMGAPDMRAAFDNREPMPGLPTGDGSRPVVPLKEITKNVIMEAERALILKTLELHHWNRRRTAETLKVSYRALIYKIRQVGLPSKRLAKRAAVVPDAIAAGASAEALAGAAVAAGGSASPSPASAPTASATASASPGILRGE